jgi:hypothetical protein
MTESLESELIKQKESIDHLISTLRELGFIDKKGKLTRPIVTHSQSFKDELDERDRYTPDFLDIANLPEMTFLKDIATPDNKEVVYPFHGESNDMIYAVRKFFPQRKFSAAIECFAGAGHAGIKLRNAKILKDNAPINAMDINPRAITLARANSAINGSDIKYHLGNVISDGFRNFPEGDKKPGETIYFGNGPFALSTPLCNLATCRDGGSDGLEKNMAFIKAALEDGSPGDAIAGVAYSRISLTEGYEFEERLKLLQAKGHHFSYRFEPVPGAKLWRGYNDKKEQANPMDLSAMVEKGAPGSAIRDEYAAMAASYKVEGWEKLGYIRYAIELTKPDTSMETRNQVIRTLKKGGRT